MADYIYTLKYRLTPEQFQGINLVQEVAGHADFNLYLTGGAIRDLIAGTSAPIRDLDFTVQGNALKLQKDFERHGAIVVASDEATHTLHLALPGKVRAEVSMARTETYVSAGKPAVIHAATIVDDMRRRDFTANAMAISLNQGSRGLLIDPANGIADIEAKVLRLVSNYGFVEDPARLIRATRFATRFGWTLEEKTQARYDSAKENGYIDHVRDSHLAVEIEQLVYEEDPLAVIRAFDEQGWLKILHPHWSLSKIDVDGLEKMLAQRKRMAEMGYRSENSPGTLYFLTHKLADNDVATIRRKIPRKDLVEAGKQVEGEAKELARELSSKEAAHPSGAWTILAAARPDLVQFVAATSRQASVVEKIEKFLGEWRESLKKLPQTEMIELNITSAMPDYANVAHQIFLQVIDGKLSTPAEIMKFLKPLAPPPPPPPPASGGKRGRAKAAEAAAAASAAAEAAKLADQPAAKAGKGKKAEKAAKAAAAAAALAVVAPVVEAATAGTAKAAKAAAKPASAKAAESVAPKKDEAKEPKAKAATKPMAKPAVRPEAKKVTKPVRVAAKPEAKKAPAKSAVKVAVKSAVKVAVKVAVKKPVAKPVKVAGKPAAKKVVAKLPAKPATKPATKSALKQVKKAAPAKPAKPAKPARKANKAKAGKKR